MLLQRSNAQLVFVFDSRVFAGGAGKQAGGRASPPPPPGDGVHAGQAAGGLVLAFLYLLATSLALGVATGFGGE